MYDLTNQKYGKLLVIKRSPTKLATSKEVCWICLCDCGKEVTVRSYCLRKMNQRSCGCTQEHNGPTKHGKWQSRTYHTWEGMKQRCSNPNADNYKHYGAQGVTVCDRWMSFENFYKDMGDRPKGKSLDRIDPFGNYEPSNCRWATPTEQANNRRNSRKEKFTHAMPSRCKPA